jgi:CO/xanthine dehydrogenase Mo-binding subunit
VDLGAYSSRQTLMTGHAARQAAADARRQVAACLAEVFGRPAEGFVFAEGFVDHADGPLDVSKVREQFLKEHRGFSGLPEGPRLTFREASRTAFVMQGTIVGRGEYRPPALGGRFKGAAVGPSPAYGCSAQIMEVAVDEGTGQLTLEHVTAAHDCGFALNRTQVEGQMQGNFLMGLGEACFEEVKFDDLGRTVNPNLAEYKIPTMLDVPDMDPVIVESGEPNGPYGAKEVGEGGIMPVIPAIMNAVHDATGIRFRELPLTPERVLTATRQLRETGEVTFAADGKCSTVMRLVTALAEKRK